MNPDEKEAGRFYCNFKVHKPHTPNQAPPERPITSQSGTICEGIATFVEHFLKPLGTKHESFLEDTPHFLRMVEQLNSNQILGPDILIATFDVIGLFTNIIHEEGLKATSDALDKRENKEVPTDYIVRMMEILLNNNIFEFDEVYWKQNVGAAMGCKPVPPYANTLMATIDTRIKILDSTKSLIFLKRFLDDYITLFRGSTKELHVLFAK